MPAPQATASRPMNVESNNEWEDWNKLCCPGLVKTNEWPKKQMASFPFILIYDFWKEEMNEPKYFTEKKNTNFQNYSLLNL